MNCNPIDQIDVKYVIGARHVFFTGEHASGASEVTLDNHGRLTLLSGKLVGDLLAEGFTVRLRIDPTAIWEL